MLAWRSGENEPVHQQALAHLETLRSVCASGLDFHEGSLKKADFTRRVEHRSDSLAAAAGNLQLDAGAGSDPVGPTMSSMTASTAAAGPRLREICDEHAFLHQLMLRGQR